MDDSYTAGSATAQAQADWPLRPWLLGAMLALAGLLVHWLTRGSQPSALPVAVAAFTLAVSLALAFTLEREQWRAPLVFALVAGLVMGGLAFQTIALREARADETFAFAAGLFAVALALPLFQAGFHRTRFATPYAVTHYHVWTDAVSAGGALAFVGIAWLLLVLLDGLFDLVGVHTIGHLMSDRWFQFAWSFGAFGTALGVLRNNLKVIGALQSVVLLVLSLLAVPLAAACALFIVLLVASGGQALWNSTTSATPLLLSCAVGCFVLANAVIRQDDAAKSGSRLMQGAAAFLAAAIGPLAVFAAISMGIRIAQHGLAPERIWALIAIGVAVAYGLAYWVGLLRGRLVGWAAYLRQANLHLAVATCVLALFLSLPLLDFGAISASNQVARLDAGKVSAENFDYAALRWDFGDAGRRALDKLAQRPGVAGERAREARDAKSQPSYWERRVATRPFTLRVLPAEDPVLRHRLLDMIRLHPGSCNDYCAALEIGRNERGVKQVAIVSGTGFTVYDVPQCATGAECGGEDITEAYRGYGSQWLKRDSQVEVKEITRHYIVIDGKPMRDPLEPDSPEASAAPAK